MNIDSKLKPYIPPGVVAVVGLAVMAYGLSTAEFDGEDERDPSISVSRDADKPFSPPADKEPTQCQNSIEGSITVNKMKVPRGTLMAYSDTDLVNEVSFGDIDPDGNFVIPNLAEGPVRLALRPAKDTILNTMGMPSKKDFELLTKAESFRRDPSETRKSNRGVKKTNLAISGRRPPGYTPDQHWILECAFSKYRSPENPDNYMRYNIVEGVQRIVIDLAIP